jgi:hypothetical protein
VCSVPYLTSLTVAYPNQHTLAVDVGDLQRADLGNTQSCSVGDHDRGAVLDPGHAHEQHLHLAWGEDFGQPLAHLGRLQRRDFLGTFQRHIVQKLQCPDVDTQRARLQLSLLEQMEQVLADLLVAHLRRRPPVVGRVLSDAP